MGRHSAAPAPEPDPASEPKPAPELDRAYPAGGREPSPSRHLVDRIALAAAAAGGTGAVMAWAGAAPGAYLLGAAGTGVVVLVAARLAGSLPGPTHPHGDGRTTREP